MRRSKLNNRDPEEVLKEFLADDSQELVSEGTFTGETHYTFERVIKEAPHERRIQWTKIVVRPEGKGYVWSDTRKFQKFLCVNGPRAGERVAEADADGYAAFNRAGRYGGDDNVPKVVLVHQDSFGEV